MVHSSYKKRRQSSAPKSLSVARKIEEFYFVDATPHCPPTLPCSVWSGQTMLCFQIENQGRRTAQNMNRNATWPTDSCCDIDRVQTSHSVFGYSYSGINISVCSAETRLPDMATKAPPPAVGGSRDTGESRAREGGALTGTNDVLSQVSGVLPC